MRVRVPGYARRNQTEVERTRHGQMGLGFEFLAANVQIYFLLTELQSAALDRRCSTDKGFELHAQYLRIKSDTSIPIDGRQYEVIKVVNHGQYSYGQHASREINTIDRKPN